MHDYHDYNSEENLKAQLRCVESDIFLCLKDYIKKFSFDKDLQDMSKKPYYEQDFTQCTTMEGVVAYGVVCNYDEQKRHEIINAIIDRLESSNDDTPEKYADMMFLALSYNRIKKIRSTVTLPAALKNHLKNFRDTLKTMYARMDKYVKHLN